MQLALCCATQAKFSHHTCSNWILFLEAMFIDAKHTNISIEVPLTSALKEIICAKWKVNAIFKSKILFWVRSSLLLPHSDK